MADKQGGTRQLAVYYTALVPKDFFYLGLLLNFEWLIQLSVQTFQLQVIIYNYNYNFVYHQWECTSIYLSLYYPFRSLGTNEQY